MKYTISEIANLLGVTTHMLRYYEKMDIIKPELNEETGYRYYSVIDSRRFNLCRTYRSMGFSIDECKKLLNWEKSIEVADMFKSRIQTIENEIFCSQEKVEIMKKSQHFLENLDYWVNEIRFITAPSFYRITFSDKEKAIKDKIIDEIKEEWLDYLPLVNWSSCIPHEVIERGEGDLYYEYGLNVPTSIANQLGLYHDEPVKLVEEAQYLVTVYKKQNREDFTWENGKNMFQFLKLHPEYVTGNGYSNIVASKVIDGKTENYQYFAVEIKK